MANGMSGCCQGGNECNHVVTIGFLREFIGSNVQDSNGSPIYIPSQEDDTYSPTYAQLTGGTYIQLWSAGSSPNGDVDGIEVNPICTRTNTQYLDNQAVNQEDLILKYTRFKSFSIRVNERSIVNPSNNCSMGICDTCISECGGSCDLIYTHVYTKYTKTMSNLCESALTYSDVNDTSSSEITWHKRSGAANLGRNGRITYTKNSSSSGEAPQRNSTFYASVTFRGTRHDSNDYIVCQSALTGGWVRNDSESGYEEYAVCGSFTVTPNSFGCSGGTWQGILSYSSHTWNVYYWKDSCGYIYQDIRQIGDDRYIPKTLLEKAGSVSQIECDSIEITTTITQTIYSDICPELYDSWTQICDPCQPCGCGDTCEEHVGYVGGIIPCTGGSITPQEEYKQYTIICDGEGHVIEKRYDKDTQGNDKIYTRNLPTITAPNNRTSQEINFGYNVVQSAGPCCFSADNSHWDTIEDIPCSAGTYIVNARYIVDRIHDDCTEENYTETTAITITVDDNCGERKKVHSSPDIYQLGGCVCCYCSSFTLNADSLVIECTDTAATMGYDKGCTEITSINKIGDNENWFTITNDTSNSRILVVARGINDTGSPKTATVIIRFTANGNSCTFKAFTITHNGCNPCGTLYIEETHIDFNAN